MEHTDQINKNSKSSCTNILSLMHYIHLSKTVFNGLINRIIVSLEFLFNFIRLTSLKLYHKTSFSKNAKQKKAETIDKEDLKNHLLNLGKELNEEAINPSRDITFISFEKQILNIRTNIFHSNLEMLKMVTMETWEEFIVELDIKLSFFLPSDLKDEKIKKSIELAFGIIEDLYRYILSDKIGLDASSELMLDKTTNVRQLVQEKGNEIQDISDSSEIKNIASCIVCHILSPRYRSSQLETYWNSMEKYKSTWDTEERSLEALKKENQEITRRILSINSKISSEELTKDEQEKTFIELLYLTGKLEFMSETATTAFILDICDQFTSGSDISIATNTIIGDGYQYMLPKILSVSFSLFLLNIGVILNGFTLPDKLNKEINRRMLIPRLWSTGKTLAHGKLANILGLFFTTGKVSKGDVLLKGRYNRRS